MMQTLKETPATIKGLSAQAWAEFQVVAHRKQSDELKPAVRQARPEARPAAVSAPSTEEIASILETNNGSDDYPSIETQMSSEGSAADKERPKLSWASSADATRTRAKSEHSTDDETVVRTKSLPVIDRKLRQAHLEACERPDDGQHPLLTIHEPQVPHQIRLRKASIASTRSNMTTGIFSGPSLSSSTEPQGKATLVQTATTRTTVHNFRSDEQEDVVVQSNKRKLSATLQVVRSRDSIYEMIWEDTLALEPTEDSEPLPRPIRHSAEVLGNKKIDTKLAAWSWGFEPTHVFVYEGTPADPSTWSANMVPASNTSKHPMATKTLGVSAPEYSSPETEFEESEPEHVAQPRRSSTPNGQISVDDFVDARQEPPLETRPSPKTINARKRRELLGNRKPSESLFEEHHFQDHRDSLILAHQRIFNETATGKTKKTVRVAPDARVESLKRSTWKRPIPGPTKLLPLAQTSNVPEGSKLINNFATRVRTPDRQSLSEPLAQSEWLQLGAQDSDPVMIPNNPQKPPTPTSKEKVAASSFLELTPKLQSPKGQHTEGLSKRLESATGSTAASRARKAVIDKSVPNSRRQSASEVSRRGSLK